MVVKGKSREGNRNPVGGRSRRALSSSRSGRGKSLWEGVRRRKGTGGVRLSGGGGLTGRVGKGGGLQRHLDEMM